MTKAEKTRQFIIEKSAPIFNTKGISGTVMTDIMEATKLAKGSLYVHFENKEDLSYAAVDHNMQILKDISNKIINKHKTAKGKIIGFLNLFSDPLNHPVFGGCPMLNFGMEADDTSPIIADKVSSMIKEVLQELKEIVDTGIAAGEFKADWDSRKFAVMVFALMEGGNLICRTTKSNAQMKIIVQIIKDEIHRNSL
ncbi:TetR/AcrR family transcriptional regulator [Pedobacter sp. UYP1]|jgi:TetR/AcrR family transcriptional repressor of nem operon|uniref:TetR/AcrR family transcriptional regulator n=1 Tax=Pedobacter sp. UYP1 TaxID=1756396 RepID=UPI0033924FF9